MTDATQAKVETPVTQGQSRERTISLDALTVIGTVLLGSGCLDRIGVAPDASEISIYVQIGFYSFYLYGCFRLFQMRKTAFEAFKRVPLLIILMTLCVVSTLWSIDPLTTFKRSFAVVGTTLLGFYFAQRYSPAQLCKLAGTGFMLAAFTTIIAVIVNPSSGIHHDQHFPAWRGWFIHKNGLGNMMAMATVCAIPLISLRETRRKGFILFFLLFGLVILSLSRTSWVEAAVLVFTCGIVAFLRAYRIGGFITLFCCTLILGSIVTMIGIDNVLQSFADLLDRDTSLTGRTKIWDLITQVAWMKHYWVGYGYEAFWTAQSGGSLSMPWRMGDFIPNQAHNGWLQVFTHLGIVGVVVMTACLLSAIGRNFRLAITAPYFIYAFGFCFLVAYTIANLTEGYFLAHNRLTWVLFVYFAINKPWPMEAKAKRMLTLENRNLNITRT